MKHRNIPGSFYLLISIFFGILFTTIATTCSKLNNKQVDQINALYDEIHKYVDENGNMISSISALKVQNANQFLEIRSKDRAILEMQAEITRLKKSVKTKGDVVYINTTTTITEKADTVYEEIIDDKIVYIDSLNRFNGWIEGRILLGKDTSNYDVKINNEYIVSLYYKRDKGLKNLFKDKTPVVEIRNNNPYTNVNNLRSVKIEQDKPSRWNLSAGVSLCLTNDFTIRPGLGLMYGYRIF